MCVYYNIIYVYECLEMSKPQILRRLRDIDRLIALERERDQCALFIKQIKERPFVKQILFRNDDL